MKRNIWRLAKIEEPNKNGIYDVRLAKNEDLISPEVETLMEYKNGEWLMKVPMFINEYHVIAWREHI